MQFQDFHDFHYSHMEFYDFHEFHNSHMKFFNCSGFSLLSNGIQCLFLLIFVFLIQNYMILIIFVILRRILTFKWFSFLSQAILTFVVVFIILAWNCRLFMIFIYSNVEFYDFHNSLMKFYYFHDFRYSLIEF